MHIVMLLFTFTYITTDTVAGTGIGNGEIIHVIPDVTARLIN